MPPRPFSLKPVTPARPTENDIEADIKRYLHARGWTVIRNHVGLFRQGPRKISIGQKGMADYLILKPAPRASAGRVLCAWIEVKRPGRVPDEHQIKWMQDVQTAGYLAHWFDSVASLDRWLCQHFGPGHDGVRL